MIFLDTNLMEPNHVKKCFSFTDFSKHEKVATYNLNPYNMDKKTRKKEKQQKQQEVLTDLQSNINDLS